MQSKKNYKNILKNLITIRLVEENIVKEYSNQDIRCPVHLSVGQEAISVGICLNLKKKDQIVLSHRCHSSYIAKGGSIKKMISELYGKSSGTNFGKAGSMHLFDKDNGVLASIPIVSSGIPMAVGAALNFKLKKLKNIGVAFYGDAATEEGIFHESLNFAATKKLPILFVCENNNYSCYTNLEERQPKDFLEKIGNSFNIKTNRLSGQNAMKVFNSAKKIINEIRKNSYPQIILIDCFRKYEHCGPLIDDHLKYRSKIEIEKGRLNCPVKYFKKHVISKKIFSKSFLEKLEKKKKKKIKKFLKLSKEKNYKMSRKLKTIYAS